MTLETFYKARVLMLLDWGLSLQRGNILHRAKKYGFNLAYWLLFQERKKVIDSSC